MEVNLINAEATILRTGPGDALYVWVDTTALEETPPTDKFLADLVSELGRMVGSEVPVLLISGPKNPLHITVISEEDARVVPVD